MCNIGDWRGGAPPPLRTPGFPRREGVRIGRRRSGRPMRLMGLRAVYREPRTSDPHPEHRVYPYLLKDLVIERANHVWYADITYIPVRRGLLYLVAVMDWASRHVLAWRLSNTLDAGFCVEALDEALTRQARRRSSIPTRAASSPASPSPGACGRPVSGSRWTAGAGCLDNVFIERLWRSLKYEAVYLRELTDGFEAPRVIGEWIGFYNTERPHSALGARTPAEAYRGKPPVDMVDKPLSALPLNACVQTPQAQHQRQQDRFTGILAA